MKKRIYIAGPITGLPSDKVKNNFKAAENFIRSMGDEPVNPYNVWLGTKATWMEYMLVCVPMLAACDSIHLLEGWEKSKGAAIEHPLAAGSNKEIIMP